MTLNTRLDAHPRFNGDSIIVKDNGGYMLTYKTNASDMFLGALVTIFGETLPDLDLCAKGECVLGIIHSVVGEEEDFSYDSDNTIDDNTLVNVYIPAKGSRVLLTAKTNTAITQGHRIQADAGFIIDFAYTDGTENTDTLESSIGFAMHAVSAAASTEKLVEVMID